MISRLVCLLFCGHIALNLGNAQKLPRVKRQNLKVQINATDDTICMKYLRLSPDTKLQGFILGYGSSSFSNQYIPLPSEGKSYVTEVDAEPRYLITVRPAPIPNHKKTCSGKTKTQKPLQLVIGTLSPTSVYLSWGILVNPQHDWTAMNSCASDRFYTVRYREKDKSKNWGFQLCPTTETVVENLKPNTPYEFGVKDNTENGIWSKIFNHKTILFNKNKENGQLQNTYKVIPNIQTQLILKDGPKLVPVTIIKQVIQNVTRLMPKTTDRPSVAGAILVHLIIPGLNETPQQKLPKPETLGISETPKKILVTNETQTWPAESKTPQVQEIAPQAFPATIESVQESIKPTMSASSEKSEASPAHSETDSGLEETKSIPKPDLAKTQNILAPSKTKRIPSKPKVSLHPEEPKTKPAATREPVPVPVTIKISSITATTKTLEHPKSTMVSYEPQHIPSKPKASASAMPEMPHSKPESSEIHFTPLNPRSSSEPKMPQSKPAPTETQFIPSKPNASPEPELPHPKPVLEHITLRIEPARSTIAPKETRRVPLKPKTSPKPHVPQTKPAPEAAIFRTEQPKTPLAPKEAWRVPSKPKSSPSPDVLQTKPAPKETRRVPSKPKTSPIPVVPPTKPAAKENRRVPSKPKTSPSPDVLQTKSVPKETQRVPSKLKTSPSPDVPHTKPAGTIRYLQEPVTATTPHSLDRAKAKLASSAKPFIPTKPKTSIKPGMPQTKPAIHQTSPQPLITKPSVTSKQTKATMAPKETRLIPSKPKISVRPEVLQTKPVPNETYQISFKPQTVLTTENPLLKTASYVIHTETIKPKISKPFGKTDATLAPHKVRLTSAIPKIFDKPQTRPALNKTTLGPGRTKTAGVMRWGGTPTETVQNFTNFLMGANISLESNITRKKPDSVATAPGRRHPPLAPAKPTQVRRKPLPPNTVTGKPGSAGIALKSRAPPSPTTIVAKSTGPTISLKMETPRKKPTVSASPEDYVNTTVFSSNPTSETDSLGKQRFTGPHVKYIPKNDSEPCSITRTLKYFQEKTVRVKENVTSPPQNPPSNLTVVTVEGCPSFVILNWTKPENDTVTYYVVLSTVNGTSNGTQKITVTTKQTHCIVENLEPNRSYDFQVKARNPLGEGPSTPKVPFFTESADPRVSEPISMGKDAIWTEVPFNSDSYSECKGKQYVKRTWYKKFVGVQLCNSLRYKIYLSDSLTGQFYNIGDERGHGEDHCQFVDSFLDGRTGQQVFPDQLPTKDGFYRAVRQEPVKFGKIGGETHITYVHWYECGTSIPGKW
ncbi:target of Nesh-SH3 isoform 32-T32 [Pangshura tecta]